MNIGPRSEIWTMHPDREDFGTSRHWSRTIGDNRYSFTVANMPNGELRLAVSVYNGYGDDGTEWGRKTGMKFGCAWTEIHSLTFPPSAR